MSDISFGNQSFQSQISFSQLTQNSLQFGQFTYLNLSPPSSLVSNIIIDHFYNDVDLDKINELFFISIQNIRNKHELLINTVGSSLDYLRHPQPKIVDFLCDFLNLYSKLSFDESLDSSTEIAHQYCHVVEQVFDKLDRSRMNWTRMNLLNLFKSDSRVNISTVISNNDHSYLFDLIEFINDCFGSVQHQLITTVKTEKKAKKNYRNQRLNAINVSVRLFKIIIEFLAIDFERFLHASFDFHNDIQGQDRPLLVRMLWSNNKYPEYMSSIVRYFLFLVAKSFRTFAKINTSIQTSIDQLRQSNTFIQSINKMLFIIAESLRMGSGNVRPYLSVTSNRNLVAADLWCQIERCKLNEDFTILRFLSKEFRSLPWFNVQFILQIMNHLFADLKHTLPMILGQNNGNRLRKTRITLRLLVTAFLTGDLDEFRVTHFRMMQRKRIGSYQDEIREKIERFKDVIKSSFIDHDENDAGDNQLSYQMYLTRKTSYGGNALHMACRQNDTDAIEKFFDQTQPNQQDRNGHTPMIDCIRYKHYKCLQTLIDISNRSNNPLNYEIAVAKENGYTALHYAIISGNRESIRLLLENGGRHLLYIESKDGYSPETMINCIIDQQSNDNEMNENLSEFISKIESKKMSNHLPLFEELSRNFQMDLDQLLSYYCDMITILFDCYLQTIRIHQFNFDDIFIDQQADYDKCFVKQSLCLRLSHEYQRIFRRNPSELELDMLIDDLKIIGRFRYYLEQFMNQLKQEQNLQDIKIDLRIKFQSLQSSMNLIQTKLGDFLVEKLYSC
ncbi:hypothetical protein HUG17_3374 [Dermatophagoides farinae]|nr:hypothetical protein HUG17_3374 [Dermatophagoides farinae]